MSHCSYQVSDKDRTELYPLYMGVELEVERRNNCPYEIGEMTHNDFYNGKTGQFAIMKSDGSLSNGFEIVTAPATLNAHRENWDTFLNGAQSSTSNPGILIQQVCTYTYQEII